MDTNNNKRKTSTDPQENEIDSNFLGDAFRAITGENEEPTHTDPPSYEKPDHEKTVDEKQDPANDK